MTASEMQNVSMAPGIHLWPGCRIQVQAVNPTTGAFVGGVQSHNISIVCEVIGTTTEEQLLVVLLKSGAQQLGSAAGQGP